MEDLTDEEATQIAIQELQAMRAEKETEAERVARLQRHARSATERLDIMAAIAEATHDESAAGIAAARAAVERIVARLSLRQ